MPKTKPCCYVATGELCQQVFQGSNLNLAIDAAQNAPWSDGRVFRHDCKKEHFHGYGDIGGTQVFGEVQS